jgi:predicted phosphodiesterase
MLIVAFSDIHAPFQDGRAVDLLCQIIEHVKPNAILNLGDWIDFYSLSRFDREPKRILRLQDELDKAFEIGRKINDANVGGAEVIVLQGNHEDRLSRYLNKHPEISSLSVLKFDRLLRLDELGWKSTDDEDRVSYISGRLRFKHGEYARKGSGRSAFAELDGVRFQISTISGHSHRLGNYYTRGPRHLVGGWETGCLCSLNPNWGNKEPDWHHGCVVVEISEQQGIHGFQPYTIAFTGKRPKRAMFWGKEFVAR